MRATVMFGAGDVRVRQVPDPKIEAPTDAIIRLSATCICGSDLWPYRGIEPVQGTAPRGHEYVGIVGQVGSAVGTRAKEMYVCVE
jgi:threonine dehydrogenase-like Zn-dependent dehydrogenase